MKIGVLSGKGGAGKTFVSVNLAMATANGVYADCDVEEPNGHLFLHGVEVGRHTVERFVPEWHEEKCTGCRTCVEFCRYHALAYINGKVKLFSNVCHSCGGCMVLCPEKAFTEKGHTVGEVIVEKLEDHPIITGCLDIGEASGIPVISSVIDMAKYVGKDNATVIIDCPPGAACSVLDTVQQVDICLLVIEPTAFGFHNFKMVYELCRVLEKPLGVVINKEEEPYEPLESFLKEEQIPIWGRIPFTKELFQMISNGEVPALQSPQYKALFGGILQEIGGAL